MKCHWFKSLATLSAVLLASVALTGCDESETVVDESTAPVEVVETELEPAAPEATAETPAAPEAEATAPAEEEDPADDSAE